jgi:hypothetical protein
MGEIPKELMRNNHEDDEFKDEDLFPDIEGNEETELNAEYLQVLEKRELIEALKLQLVQKELNYVVLLKTIRYLEKSWFWRFKSSSAKLNSIVETYQLFKALIDMDVSQYQEEETAE